MRRFKFRATIAAESAALLGAGNVVVTVMGAIVCGNRIHHNASDCPMRTATKSVLDVVSLCD
jgi:hypothetical protein